MKFKVDSLKADVYLVIFHWAGVRHGIPNSCAFSSTGPFTHAFLEPIKFFDIFLFYPSKTNERYVEIPPKLSDRGGSDTEGEAQGTSESY